ncbi:hypothetical protein RM572_21960 [Streptomyces sp. DSM 42041]|uniref:ATP-grasp-modified RiPP n=1 Tax=Streptomyces hazeniae TaxID=3075538 RepID=A0ABU2NYZ3_9ACTN|nr:hypothetical protein [Streptomyces sp. DSM 42041]MDT0381428.1 hypothetical protein [Streptomyces sp. DSM 42041]
MKEDTSKPGEPLRTYRVQLNGFDTTMRLSESDLPNYPGAVAVDDGEASTLSAKARSTSTNKARTGARNKAADGGGA